MKKLLIILLTFLSLSVSATNYYVATAANGGNDGNPGTLAEPWLTVAYACSQVAAGAHTIYVGAGTFAEGNNRMNLAAGVSLIGVDQATSIITSTYNGGGYTLGSLHLASAEGTNGNQRLSNFTMDGNLTGYRAITIFGRSNVTIDSITVIDFYQRGIAYYGDEDNSEPETYATGNKIFECTLTNNGIYSGGGDSNLEITGQTGFLAYDLAIDQTGRAAGSNGKCIGGNYLKGCSIYSNTLTNATVGETYGFAIEIWNVSGLAIYENVIVGNTDINIVAKGTYTYGLDFHDNTVGPTTLYSGAGHALFLEAGCSDVIIRNNYFKNLFGAIKFYTQTGGKVNTNVQVYYNIVNGGRLIYWEAADVSTTTSYVYIYNNTCYMGTTNVGDGIELPGTGTANYIYIRNNIINGYNRSPIYAWFENAEATIDLVWIENNVIYGCGNSNDPKYATIVPTNVTDDDGIKEDPLFTTAGSDFTLQAASPAIDAGIGVGLTLDYLGNVVGDSPDIGAYEYDASPPSPPPLLPAITTVLTRYYSKGATVGGSDIDDGGGTISAKGVCYSTSANPTTSDSKVSGGITDANFSVRIVGLSASTTYHMRAYVTNEEGTTYGGDMSFTTPEVSYVYGDDGKVLTDDDGKIIVW